MNGTTFFMLISNLLTIGVLFDMLKSLMATYQLPLAQQVQLLRAESHMGVLLMSIWPATIVGIMVVNVVMM